MTALSNGELRALLERDLPGALVAGGPTEEPAERQSTGEEQRPLLQAHDAIVAAERLPEVARYLRNTLGYGYLSYITAVDYLEEGLIEVVYFFYHLEGGGPQIVRVRVPRGQAVIPSISPFWPGANLQEREAYDLFGVDFPGHPYLRRIYMWDEFEGYPLRKDFPKTGDKYTHVTGGEE